MIVNYTGNGWEIITQRAHGLLAAQLAMQWQKKNRPERWTETVLAIAEHDDAQTELEADDLLTPQGGPVNFAMKTFELEHCSRLMDFSISKSRYIALLTSMHITFLHHREAEKNLQAKAFLDKQTLLQAGWRKELKISQKESVRIYNLLEWCDALSLLLCQHGVQPENRVIEISQGPDSKQYKLMEKENGALSVKPWPFEEKSFSVRLETRVLSQLSFKHCDEFKRAFLSAKVTEKAWTLEK